MTVVGNWDDPGAGKKAAEAMLIAGIDVIYCMGMGPAVGYPGRTEAREAGKEIYYIGYLLISTLDLRYCTNQHRL